MELIRGIHNLQPRHKGCILAIGNFDGVHRGHQLIVEKLTTISKRWQVPNMLMLFEPQPQEFFAKQNISIPALARLTSLREKCYYLRQAGINSLLCIRFNKKIAQLSAKNFIEQLLVKNLAIKAICIGDNFRFGAKRHGNVALLTKYAMQYDFTVLRLNNAYIDNVCISSTTIRQALQTNRLAQATKLLGHSYMFCGRVIHGNKLGGTIGFPTANILIKHLNTAVRGVYVVSIKQTNSVDRFGVANIGFRPTVAGKRLQLEVHIFDFNGSLYGHRLQIILHHKLRQEQYFPSLNALAHQIACDIQKARRLLSTNIR